MGEGRVEGWSSGNLRPRGPSQNSQHRGELACALPEGKGKAVPSPAAARLLQGLPRLARAVGQLRMGLQAWRSASGGTGTRRQARAVPMGTGAFCATPRQPGKCLTPIGMSTSTTRPLQKLLRRGQRLSYDHQIGKAASTPTSSGKTRQVAADSEAPRDCAEVE